MTVHKTLHGNMWTNPAASVRMRACTILSGRMSWLKLGHHATSRTACRWVDAAHSHYQVEGVDTPTMCLHSRSSKQFHACAGARRQCNHMEWCWLTSIVELTLALASGTSDYIAEFGALVHSIIIFNALQIIPARKRVTWSRPLGAWNGHRYW